MRLDRVAQAIAALLPEDAIIVDEGITSSAPVQAATETARGHDWLSLTGGAIGDALPVATGAAIACPAARWSPSKATARACTRCNRSGPWRASGST